MSFYPVRAPRSRSTPGQPRIRAPLFSHSDHLTRCASTQTSPLTASAYLCDTYLSSHPVHRLRTSPLNPIPSPSLHLLTTSIDSKLYQVGTMPPQHTHAHPSSAGQPWNVPEPRETLVLPLPHYSCFFAAGSSSLSDDDTSSVPGRPLISYRVAPLIGCAHPIRIKRHPISRPYRVASLIVCAHVGRWAAAEGW